MAGTNASPQIIIRPKEVEKAIKLLLTSLVFGAIAGYLNLTATTDHLFIVYSDIILLSLLINGYFVYKISHNRNWARKFYIAFTLLSTLFYLPQLGNLFTSTPLNGLLQLANMLIQLVAVYFLLRRKSKEWFQLVK